MNAAKAGYIAEFKTGYLQREIRINANVTGGKDKGLRDGAEGIAVGRLVKVTADSANGDYTVTAVTGSDEATQVAAATHIIAQSDDTIRDVPSDYNYPEQYTTLPNLVVKNTTDATDKKTVAVYAIINKDDLKVINLGGTDPYTGE